MRREMRGAQDAPGLEKGLPIESLHLTTRSRNCLRRSGVHTLGDLSNMTRSELRRIRSIGPMSAAEIEGKLYARGLSLKEEGAARGNRDSGD